MPSSPPPASGSASCPSLPEAKGPASAARRRGLAALAAAALAWAQRAPGQDAVPAQPGVDARALNTAEGVIQTLLAGAAMRRGRVKLELPALAENGHSVPMTVSVASPMTAADHVLRIDLVSEKNPVTHMATFFLGPWNARAEISSRIRLNGTQRITAIAQLADGSFWFDAADVTVTEAACLDGG